MSRIVVFASLVLCACSQPRPDFCDGFVVPGGDDQAKIQEMLVSAAPGQTLCLGSGTYKLSDTVNISNLERVKIVGVNGNREDIKLDFAGQTAGANGFLAVRMKDITLENFTVVNASGNGITVQTSDRVVMRNLVAGWERGPNVDNGKYALYPVESSNVLVEGCKAFGASDAGLYIGQNEKCVLRNNDARQNVLGIEIENTVDCEAYDNHVEDNTSGFLVVELPSAPKRGRGVSVYRNTIVNNNLENFAAVGTIAASAPQGTGVLLVAPNETQIRDNRIENNRGTGSLAITWPTVMGLTGDKTQPDPTYDGYLDQVYLTGNTFVGNGTMPALAPDPLGTVSAIMKVSTLEDVLWDGVLRAGQQPTELCLGDMSFTYRNLDAEHTFDKTTTDKTPHQGCMPALRPPVALDPLRQ
jgi:parallel beta-helix repeat protein